MRFLFCYDITKPKRLRTVAKRLEDRGIRIQRSFFICEFDNEKQAGALFSELQEILNIREDSLFLYPICIKCQKKTLMIGDGIFEIMQEYRIL